MVRVPPLARKRRPDLAQQIHRSPHDKPEIIDAESPSGEAA